MPVVKIPLVGSYNPRGMDADEALVQQQDQRYKNATFSTVQNPITGKLSVYVEKRPGFVTDSIVASGNSSTGMIRPVSINENISAFGTPNSTIYYGQSSVGTITGRAVYFSETVISGLGYALIKSSDGTGWYYANGAKDTTAYTMDGNNSTTVTDIKISGSNSTAGLYPGQKLTAATNIAAGTRIVSVNSGAFTAVLDTATTGGAFNDLAVTKEPIAKLIDADFVTTGTYVSGFVEMDGYLFYSSDANIWNSDLNSITAYSATAFKAVDMSPDLTVALARSKNVIVAFGTGSIQGFQNAGYATGSPLERLPQTFSRIGAQSQGAVATLENDIFFVGSSNYGDIQAWKMTDFAPQKVSTPFVDKILGTMGASGNTNYVSAVQFGGYPYMMISMSTAVEGATGNILLETGDAMLLESGDNFLLEADAENVAVFGRQLVYNAKLNIWSEWDASVATFVIGQGAGSYNSILATSRYGTGGKIYRIAPATDGNVYTDDGTAYDLEIRTARIDHGTTNRKFVKQIRLVGDAQTTGTATLEASNDDYATWETLGTFDMTQMDKKIVRCGSYKGGRAYRITHSDAAPFRAEALEIEYEVGKI